MSEDPCPTHPNGEGGGDAACDPTAKCEKDTIKIVELVEVVMHKGTETNSEAKGRKQYINLDDTVLADDPHPEFGRFINLKARAEWVSGDKSKSLSGQTVSWYSEPGGDNMAGLTGTEKEGFEAAGGDAVKTKSTDEDGWTPVIQFFLSQYGGDTFDVFATDDSTCKGGLKAGTYEVWRKLWFEVDTMKKTGGGTLEMDHSKLPARYTPCFIELEKQGTDNEPENVRNIETGDLHDFANDYFGAEVSPFQSHEAGIDHQADKSDIEKTFNMTAKIYTDGTAESYYVYDGGDTWLKSAQYNDGSGWKDLDKGKVSLDGADKVYKQIKIDLSAGPVEPTGAKPVDVKLCYVLAKEWSGDGGNKPHAIVAMGYWYDTETEEEAKKRTVGTMAHELGHLLGMVPKTSSTHVDTGTGDHCTDVNCVMYSTNTATRGSEFCSVCEEELRKADLTIYSGLFTHTKGAKA